MTHPKAWPADIVTRRGTNEDIGQQLHRVHVGPLVCTANRCDSGRKACPCPEACQLPDEPDAPRLKAAALILAAFTADFLTSRPFAVACVLVCAAAAVALWVTR